MATEKAYSFLGDDFPAINFESVTPSDSTDFDKPPRSLFVGVGGDISVQNPDGTEVIFKNVGTGVILPIQPIRVNATNTNATDIVALY